MRNVAPDALSVVANCRAKERMEKKKEMKIGIKGRKARHLGKKEKKKNERKDEIGEEREKGE